MTLGLAVPVAVAVVGCVAGGVRNSERVDAPTLRIELADLPFDEYWTGLVFNDNKVGFSHLAVRHDQSGEFELRSRASMRFRILGVDKGADLIATDWVGADLQVRRFSYAYDLDGSGLRQEGVFTDGVLKVAVHAGETVEHKEFRPAGPLYPAAVISLYPVVKGLAAGTRYTYQVYDGETGQIVPVEQDVEGPERSDFFEGLAFRIETRMFGGSTTTWIGSDGRPVLERSMNGVFMARLAPANTTRRHLARAVPSKHPGRLDVAALRTTLEPSRPVGPLRTGASWPVARRLDDTPPRPRNAAGLAPGPDQSSSWDISRNVSRES